MISGAWTSGCVSVTGNLSIPVPGHQDSGEGDTVHLTVRPEKIWLSDLTPQMFRASGTIVATSYHGATTQYIVSIAPGLNLTVLEQNLPQMRADDRWHSGDRVEVGWLSEHIMVLT